MGRYNKGTGKQIVIKGAAGAALIGAALAVHTANVYAASENTLIQHITITSVSEYAMDTEVAQEINENADEAGTLAEITGVVNKTVPYYNEKGYGWKKTGGEWTYVKEDGTLQVNWLLDADDKYYFFDEDGVMLKGFIRWKNQSYYMNPDGSMQEGWFKYEDGVYYLRPGNGDMFVGVQTVDGVTYDFGTDGRALGLTEIPTDKTAAADVTLSGLNEDETVKKDEPQSVMYDVMGYGWKQNPDSTWSYYNKDGSLAKNWLFDETNHYYFMGSDGKMQTGYIEWCEQRYFLNEDGRMQEGFFIAQDGIYYFRPGNGDMILGLYAIDGMLYNFGEDGRLLTGWQNYNDSLYFLDPATGEAVKGIAVIDGMQYGFDSEGKLDMSVIPWNLVLVNYNNVMPENYEINLKKVNGYNVDARIADALTGMINAAKKDGVKLKITSAYRTIETQTRLYNNGLTKRLNAGMSYEAALAERNLYNAEPGKSEHNLGLALDFIAGGVLNERFAESSQAAWLSEHAHEYGFILRYEASKVDITKIAWEPWHYRYVGVEAATAIHESGVCLEEYFANYSTNTDVAGVVDAAVDTAVVNTDITADTL